MRKNMEMDIDKLGDWFVEEQIGRIFHITFEQYLSATDFYDSLMCAYNSGCGICLHPDHGPKAIESESLNVN